MLQLWGMGFKTRLLHFLFPSFFISNQPRLGGFNFPGELCVSYLFRMGTWGGLSPHHAVASQFQEAASPSFRFTLFQLFMNHFHVYQSHSQIIPIHPSVLLQCVCLWQCLCYPLLQWCRVWVFGFLFFFFIKTNSHLSFSLCAHPCYPTLPLRSCSFQGTTSNANSRRYENNEPFTFLELRTSFEQDMQLSPACNLGKVATALSSALKFVHYFEICFSYHLAVTQQVELLTMSFLLLSICVLKSIFTFTCVSPSLCWASISGVGCL